MSANTFSESYDDDILDLDDVSPFGQDGTGDFDEVAGNKPVAVKKGVDVEKILKGDDDYEGVLLSDFNTEEDSNIPTKKQKPKTVEQVLGEDDDFMYEEEFEQDEDEDDDYEGYSEEDLQGKYEEIINEVSGNKKVDPTMYPDDIAETIAKLAKSRGTAAVAEYLIENEIITPDENEIDYNFSSQIATLSDEDVLVLDVRDKCPECTPREIQEQVSNTLASNSAEKIIVNLRNKYLQTEKSRYKQRQEKEMSEERERVTRDSWIITEEVRKVGDILGFENTPDIVEALLPEMLDYDPKHKLSAFMKNLMSDPKAQYEALFFLNYKDDIARQYKQAIAEAKKQGAEELMRRLPKKPKKYSNTPTSKSRTKSNKPSKPTSDIIDMDDFI